MMQRTPSLPPENSRQIVTPEPSPQELLDRLNATIDRA